MIDASDCLLCDNCTINTVPFSCPIIKDNFYESEVFMQETIMLNPDDIKELIAEKFHVSPKDIIKTQYSYIIPKDKIERGEKNADSRESI